MLARIKNFLKDEVGAETMEYIAIAAIIIVAGGLAYNNAAVATVITAGMNAITGAIPG